MSVGLKGDIQRLIKYFGKTERNINEMSPEQYRARLKTNLNFNRSTF